MKSRSRSFSGIALMLVLIPMFAGILACMPVPIGDSERSKIDPELTGVWAALSNEANFDQASFYVFEPYDKRTWLISGVQIDSGIDVDSSGYDFSSYEGFASLAAETKIGGEGIRVENLVLYKSWLKKLGGETFTTWEPKALLDSGFPEPEVWFVYRIVKDSPDQLRLVPLDGDSTLFRGVEKTRRAFERVIRKNVHNAELYHESEDGVAEVTLVRVQANELGFFERLLGSVVNWD
jgi:hypothetical protein